MEASLVQVVVGWVRQLLAVATTVVYGAIIAWLADKGLDIDTAWIETALVAIAAGLVVIAEKALNYFVPMLRPLITFLRLGQSLPVYEHEGPALDAAA